MKKTHEGAQDLSVKALCAAHDFAGDPHDLILELCSDLLSHLDDEVPVDLDVLTSVQNIIRVEELTLDHDANLCWDGTHYVVQVNSNHSLGRQRFSTCHEVVHTFFPNGLSQVGLPDRDIGRSSSRVSEESLCDFGAAELLMPRKQFKKLLPALPDMTCAIDLADIFCASIEASARRVLTLSGIPGSVVVLEPKLTVAQEREIEKARLAPALPGISIPGPASKIRVRYSMSTLKKFVPRNKSVAVDCPLAEILNSEAVDYFGETGLIEGKFNVSARLLPYMRDGIRIDRVIALLFENGWC